MLQSKRRVARAFLASSLSVTLLAWAGAAASDDTDIAHMSLPNVLDMIRGAVASQGVVAWQGQVTDDSNGSTWTYQSSMERTGLVIDAPSCQFRYHFKAITNGAVTSEVNAMTPFREVIAIESESETQRLVKVDAQTGHPTWRTTTSPQIFEVIVYKPNGYQDVFAFYDKGVADQASKAMERARELCR